MGIHLVVAVEPRSDHTGLLALVARAVSSATNEKNARQKKTKREPISFKAEDTSLEKWEKEVGTAAGLGEKKKAGERCNTK